MVLTVMRDLLHLRSHYRDFSDLEGLVTKIVQMHDTMSFYIAGLRITSDVLIGKSAWDALFQPPNFFSKYKYMISTFCVCLIVTLSLSFSGLYYRLYVCPKVDAIKIYFDSVVFHL